MKREEIDDKFKWDLSLMYKSTDEFKEDLTVWRATIDSSLCIRFQEPSMLFDLDKAILKPKFKEILDDFFPRYIKVLNKEEHKDNIVEIRIEGHTDNVPINTAKYPSNDVLSSYRALAMFHYLVENTNLDPAKLKHSGRGEYMPVADNSTPEGRAKNRRIEIKIYNTLSGE